MIGVQDRLLVTLAGEQHDVARPGSLECGLDRGPAVRDREGIDAAVPARSLGAAHDLVHDRVAVLAARTLGPSGFGLFSIAFTVYVTAQGASRAMVGEPLLIHPKEIEERTGEAIASGVVLGVAFALVVAAGAALTSIWSSGLAWSLLVLAVAMPALVLQDQGRYLVTIKRDFLDSFYDQIYPYAGLFVPWIGSTGGASLKLGDARPVPVADLKAAYEGWFPTYMAGEIAA